MNKKGFTLLELLLVIVIIVIIFLLSIPIVKVVIENSKLSTFESGVKSVIDAVDLYIANNEFAQIPEEGIEIALLDEGILKNNNFDEGVVVRNEKQTRIIFIKKDNYCAKGTKSDLTITSKGCGALDETKPTKANLFLKSSNFESLTIVGAGYDENSKIVKYELSVDNGKYYTNKDSSYNVFEIKINDNIGHNFKVRVTNEAGKTLESKIKTLAINSNNETLLLEQDKLENVQSKKTITLLQVKDTKYEYSNDLVNWNLFTDNLTITNNEKIYFRITKDNIISYNTLNISNIDTTLNGAYPKLDENMIPVIYDGTNWIVANKNKTYWDYDNKIWANAVVVRKNKDISDNNSKSREYYLLDTSVGETIYSKDIIGFYVWIPRYKYKLWNINGNNNKTNSIEIIFENNKVTKSTIEKNDNWFTHPAFSYDKEANGFWASKYEASVSSNSNCFLIPNEINCNTNELEIYSLNSEKSLKYISISNASTIVENLNSQFNISGLTKNSNPHLLTNLEWGAITYLSNSKYGINSNIESETTTGNSTGVYNMGINQEFVMGNYNNDTGLNNENNSGFTPTGSNEWPITYKDIYKSISLSGRKIGDSTMETNSWYDNINVFINGENPFIIRGIKNIYSYYSSTGSSNELTTFRSSLSIK